MKPLRLVAGTLTLFGGAGLLGYATLGWIVTASTGVPTGGQRIFLRAMATGGGAASLAGLGLLVSGLRGGRSTSGSAGGPVS
jgi:hypothetical protein